MFSEEVTIEIFEWYKNLEQRLLEVTNILPIVNEADLKRYRSPRLVPILVETCSIIDTLFRAAIPEKFNRPTGRETTRRGANIYDYYRELEKTFQLTNTKTLLLYGKPSILSPFDKWSEDSNKPMEWWKTYNRLKHDRLKASNEANLFHCINALCALMQVMTKFSSIMEFSLRVNWIQTAGYNPVLAIEDVCKINDSKYVTYSELFATFLAPNTWQTVDDIRPINIRNSDKLIAHLGRLEAKHEI